MSQPASDSAPWSVEHSEVARALEVTRNPWIWGAVILCTGLLVAAVYVPILSEVLGTEEPGKEGWLLVVTLSFAPVVVGQGLRAISQIRRRYGRQVDPEHGGTA